MTALEEIQENIDLLYKQIEVKKNELDCLTERYKELCNMQFQMINSYGSISDYDFDSLAGF